MIGTKSFICLVLAAVALAQDLSVPSTWRSPTSDRSHDERVQISQAAIDALKNHMSSDNNGEFDGIGYWQSGNAWGSIAQHDFGAGLATNHDQVIDSLNRVFDLNAHFDKWGYNDDALWWAQAALYAYRAYPNSPEQFEHASAVWDFVSQYQLTQAQTDAGSTPVKNGAIMGACDGKSNAGAVFWRPTIDDLGVNSITTGLFLTLSASLYEITSDEKYHNAATAAVAWLRDSNSNDVGLPFDGISLGSCSKTDWMFTYNAGKMIEGLAVLAEKTGDAGYKDLLTKVAAASMKSSPWQGEDGVISEGASRDANNDGVGFKSVLIRALHETYIRSDNADLKNLIKSYTNVQFNALQDLAKNGDSYSSAWLGPSQDYNSWGQLAALDPLYAVIREDD